MKTYVFDLEVYRNYFLACFADVDSDETHSFEYPLDKEKLINLVENNRLIGFNSLNYDLPILHAALGDRTEDKIKNISDRLIKNGWRYWQTYDAIGVKKPLNIDHIDLIEVAPGKASLKIYGGRMHSKRMQSLPIHHDAWLTHGDKKLIKDYCINDLSVTKDLYNALSKQLDLRAEISKEINSNVMSKSDAQIAEAVFKSRIPNVQKPKEDSIVSSFNYKVPDFIRFKTQKMKDILKRIADYTFTVAETGKCIFPKDLTGYVHYTKTGIPKDEPAIELFGKKYMMGIGGLHSTEKSISHLSTAKEFLADHDVASYYPSIILNQGLYPDGCGPEFLTAYRTIYEQRLKAKAMSDKVTANTLKITLNGSFGKLGSKYSFLFAPQLLIQTTLTGQLALLMLIEQFEIAGIPVVSANTDGVVVKCPVERELDMYDVILHWESQTEFVTEENRYAALYSKDVNNYIALQNDGGVKTKGLYAGAGLMKNVTNPVCVRAVIEYLQKGIDIETTIKACNDIRYFVTIRTVKGGAIDQTGADLGTAIRWYYATGVDGPIKYAVNGNKVPKSEGAKACQLLPDDLPKDIDYAWYVAEAERILEDIGFA